MKHAIIHFSVVICVENHAEDVHDAHVRCFYLASVLQRLVMTLRKDKKNTLIINVTNNKSSLGRQLMQVNTISACLVLSHRIR